MNAPASVEQQPAQTFAARMLDLFTGGVLSLLVEVGYRTGLFEVAATGPATSQELAGRAGLQERYVREWLGAMATGGIVLYDGRSRRYTLPPEHATLLTGGTMRNVAPSSQLIRLLARHVPAVADCFRDGGGVPYEAYRPEFTRVMDDSWRRIYDDQLIDGFLARVPGLLGWLAGGIRVADVGCGTGLAVNVMAREFPASTFVGYDLAADAIGWARAEADEMGLTNARFEVLDVAELPSQPPFDLVTAFDAIHDQVHPLHVLRRVRAALAPGGTFYMVEFKLASDVGANVGNPFAPLYYGVSLLHCMTVSLAHGGAGLGAAWGEDTARRLLSEAGFRDVMVVETPRPQNHAFVCRRP